MPDFAPEVDPEVELRHDDPEDVPAPDDLDMEAPEADVAAQRATVVDEAADEDAAVWEPVPDGVDPADATAQRRVVAPDEEEEYR